MYLMIHSLTVVLTTCIVVHGNELALTFDADDSRCTAQCSTCSSTKTGDDNGGDISSDVIDDLRNITYANSEDIQETLQQVARISSMLYSLKNTAMTTSATVNDILVLVEELVQQHNETSSTMSLLPTSCKDVKTRAPSSPSGEYLIATPNGGTSQYVYCYMETLCHSDEGWTRLAHLDMTDPSENCPSEFVLKSEGGVRACGRQTSSEGSCDSITFSSKNVSYSEICGKVIGYQNGNAAGLKGNDGIMVNDIESFYVDGVSITRGSPRQHVWTFIVGNSAQHLRGEDCPCNDGNTAVVFPSFIGKDYFCESGYPGTGWPFIHSDPLWDGMNCPDKEAPCCTDAGLPWFNTTLSAPSTDFFELRMCSTRAIDNDGLVGQYDIYVK